MCGHEWDEHEWDEFAATTGHGDGGAGEPSRRHAFALAGLGVLASDLALDGGAPSGHSLGVPTRASAGGVVRTATHIHSSFSEGASGQMTTTSPHMSGSMEAQAAVLASMGVDLLFYTDHDHRMAAEVAALRPTPFATTEDFAAPQWTYRTELSGKVTAGAVAQTSAGLVATVTSGAGSGTTLAWADPMGQYWNYRATLAQQTLTLTVTPPKSGAGWAEFRIRASYRPATGGRPAGSYELIYRLQPSATARTVTTSRTTVTITLPVPRGRQTVTLKPVNDIAAAFPDLGRRAEDNSLYGFWIGAGAPSRSSAEATFHRVDFSRGCRGDSALALQEALRAELQPLYPTIRLVQGLELSYTNHINWLGATSPTRILPPAASDSSATSYTQRIVSAAHAAGACVTLNHPFGANRTPLFTGTDRANKILATATKLLRSKVYGADALEVGYNIRGNVDLAAHLELWDIVLAAGLRIGAVGCSDNHSASPITSRTDANIMVSDIIATSSRPEISVPALIAGRAFVSHWGGYGGMLDLTTASARMGGIQLVGATPLDLGITATDLPAGGSLRVVQYAVHGDRNVATRRAAVLDKVLAADRVTGGTTGVTVQPVPSYVRSEVRNAAGAVVAFSNPLYLAAP